MAILGIGIDVVDIERFKRSLERDGFAEHVFTEGERVKGPSSLAARFAAKEAIAKALGAPGYSWLEAEVVSDESGAPSFLLHGRVKEHVEELGVTVVHLSLSHDAGIASAFVVLEGP